MTLGTARGPRTATGPPEEAHRVSLAGGEMHCLARIPRILQKLTGLDGFLALPAKHFLNADDEPIKRCVRVEGKAFSFTSFENPASCPLDLSSMVFLAILKSRLP